MYDSAECSLQSEAVRDSRVPLWRRRAAGKVRLDLQIKFEVRGHTHTVLLLFDSAFKSLYLSKTEGKTGLNTQELTNKAQKKEVESHNQRNGTRMNLQNKTGSKRDDSPTQSLDSLGSS